MLRQNSCTPIDSQKSEAPPGPVDSAFIKTGYPHPVKGYECLGVQLSAGTAECTFGDVLNTEFGSRKFLVKTI
jgi:hypothetical protein